jgi:hypothetical protein
LQRFKRPETPLSAKERDFSEKNFRQKRFRPAPPRQTLQKTPNLANRRRSPLSRSPT